MINADVSGITSSPSACVVRMRDVTKRVNLSESHLYLLISQGKFPAPFPLVPGGKAMGWLNSTIDEYLASRVAARGVEK